MSAMIRPKGDWRRTFVLATQISHDIAAPVLALRTRTLVREVVAKFQCSTSTAMKAVSLARVRQGLERRRDD